MNTSTNRSGAVNGGGLVLIGLGIFFLLGQLFDWDLMVGNWGWPFIVIGVGLLFFVGMAVGGRSSGGLAVPGSIITMIGLILLYQNTFDHFESWAYAWALIPTAVGIGIIVNGRWSGEPSHIQRGGRLMKIGLTLFGAGFVFFELLLNLGGFVWGRAGHSVGPLFLIAAGIYLFMRNPRAPIPATRPEAELEALVHEEAKP